MRVQRLRAGADTAVRRPPRRMIRPPLAGFAFSGPPPQGNRAPSDRAEQASTATKLLQMVENHLRALAFLVSPDGVGLILRIALRSTLGLAAVFVLAAILIDTSSLRIEIFGFTFNYLESLAFWVSLGSVFAILTILWLPVVALATSLYLEGIADAAERRYCSNLDPPRPVPLGQAIRSGIRIFLLTGGIAATLLVASPVLGPLAPFLGAAATGYVLAREYHDLIAARRLPPVQIAISWQHHRGAIWIAGTVASLAMLVPVLNLFAPVYGVAFAALSFHDPHKPGHGRFRAGVRFPSARREAADQD